MKQRASNGFMLTELLVVIAIIAILAVSLIPAFSHSRRQARSTSCVQQMGQIHKAITMYEVDFEMYPTVAKGDESYTKNPQDALNLLYRQYIDDVRVFSCPSAKMTPAQLNAVRVSSAQGYSGSLVSSFGYSPGHTSSNSRVVILADKKGTGANSDNHGKNRGQLELTSGGSVAWIPALPDGAPPTNNLGNDDHNVVITDVDIFTWNSSATYKDWDSGCQ